MILESALLFERQQQQINDKVKVKLDFNTVLFVRPKMNGIERALNTAKKQFNLPAVGIEHDNLMGFQIKAIREDEVYFSQGGEAD
jgi:hypothetical protein